MAPSMRHLPEELVIEILSRLPPRSLFKFRCVSKPWSVLFNNPKLISMIKNNFSIMLTSTGNDLYTIDNKLLSSSLSSLSSLLFRRIHCPVSQDYYGKGGFVGYCNGLFCISEGHDGFRIWNPSTRDWKGIPSPPQFQVDDSLRSSSPVIEYIYGLGYDRKSDDYKFVHIAINYSNFNRSEVKIYSLKSNSWKQIQHIPRLLQSSRGYGSQWCGVFCNGALHWKKSSSSEALIALHMTDENMREISQPENLDVKFGDSTRIDVLDGCLCMLCCSTYNLGFEVWLMKDYGNKESWNKIYSISELTSLEVKWLRCLRRIKCLKTGELLLEVHYGDMNGAYREDLVLYDPKNEKFTVLNLDKIWSSFLSLSNPLDIIVPYLCKELG